MSNTTIVDKWYNGIKDTFEYIKEQKQYNENIMNVYIIISEYEYKMLKESRFTSDKNNMQQNIENIFNEFMNICNIIKNYPNFILSENDHILLNVIKNKIIIISNTYYYYCNKSDIIYKDIIL